VLPPIRISDFCNIVVKEVSIVYPFATKYDKTEGISSAYMKESLLLILIGEVYLPRTYVHEPDEKGEKGEELENSDNFGNFIRETMFLRGPEGMALTVKIF